MMAATAAVLRLSPSVLLAENDLFREAKKQIFEARSIGNEFTLSIDDPIPQKLMEALRISSLREVELYLVDPDVPLDFVSPWNEMSALSALQFELVRFIPTRQNKGDDNGVACLGYGHNSDVAKDAHADSTTTGAIVYSACMREAVRRANELCAPLGHCGGAADTVMDPACDALMCMGSSLGIFTPKLKIANFAHTGRGMRAEKAIRAMEDVCVLPLESLVSSRTAHASPLSEALRAVEGLPDELVVVLFLIRLAFVDTSTPWKPYVDALPACTCHRCRSPADEDALKGEENGDDGGDDDVASASDTLTLRTRAFSHFGMDPDEFQKVAGATALIDEIEKEKTRLESSYSALFPSLSSYFPALLPHSAYTFDHFVWAQGIVDSRAFTFAVVDGDAPDGPQTHVTALLPVADMMNHSSVAHVIARRYDAATDSLRLVALADVPQGEQVFLSYGPWQNWQLLMHYGFSLHSNPYDTVHFAFSMPDDEEFGGVRSQEEKTTLAALCGLPLSDHYLAVGRLSPSLLACMRLAVATRDELALLRGNPQAIRAKLFKHVTRDNEVRALDTLASVVQSLRDAMLAGIEGDGGTEGSVNGENVAGRRVGENGESLAATGARENVVRFVRGLVDVLNWNSDRVSALLTACEAN